MTEITVNQGDLAATFINAATWLGDLIEAEAILASHPETATCNIHTAAIMGNEAVVRRFLDADAGLASAIAAPYGGTALVYLCMSKYLRLDKSREGDFIKTARALLDAGADANAGFWVTGPYPDFETALYGAAGVAQNTAMTRLLIEYGADPNDNEVCYHSPETYDNDAMKVLVETGKLTDENLTMMLIRKHDWHDYAGAKYLLEHGANPNIDRQRGWYPMHHALMRNNQLPMIALLLDHGSDPSLVNNGLSAIERAAWEGRSDVLQLFKERGIDTNLQGIHGLIAACAITDSSLVQAIAAEAPQLVSQVITIGGDLLGKFAGGGNEAGVAALLNLGVKVDAPFASGDAYFGTPKNSLAIHVAAWRGHPAVVKLLIERGSPVDVPDNNGDTPLVLAVRACVASYWLSRRSPDSVEALLHAGASAKGITLPTGYAEIDVLLNKATG